MKLTCTDKFGKVIQTPKGKAVCDVAKKITATEDCKPIEAKLASLFTEKDSAAEADKLFTYVKDSIGGFTPDQLRFCIETIKGYALKSDDSKQAIINSLTLLNDRRFNTGSIKRSSLQHVIKIALDDIFDVTALITEMTNSRFSRINFASREQLRAPKNNEKVLIVDAEHFEPEGDLCDAVMIVKAFKLGWNRFMVYKYRGQRFTGCGFGPATKDVRIDIYGASGDYIASGIDGMEIYVHGNAQDQLCQIMKEGKLVVFGDVGQTFMYGAKGGSAYIMGNAAGRPLINAVGRPRVVINGTALDYLAESFMAGDPLNGGGFVILNGIGFNDEDGSIYEYESPYPGSNIFSLASGGAIYVRDPRKKLVDEQLNGGEYTDITDADWNLIETYLEENEKLFGITIERLLTVDGNKKTPQDVYRKIRPLKAAAVKKDDDGLEE
jgi:glutamate synthase domain-containing protein 3